ncbi:MAG: hypothetical protein KA533_10025 [Sphingobium sp.]|nr:hypothetical protein [Sphingobium sp.]
MIELSREDIDATLASVDQALDIIEYIDLHNCADHPFLIAVFTMVDDLIGDIADILSCHDLTEAQRATFTARIERYEALGVVRARTALVQHGGAHVRERLSN